MINRSLLISASAVLLALGFGHPSHAAPAESWQNPCFPMDTPDYYFGQYVSGGWGYHTGADICHNSRTPEYATANGVVVYSARTPDSYRWGNLVIIEHTDPAGGKIISLYGHMDDDRQVFAGQPVVKGQLLGYAGPDYSAANGNWGAHLHFGLHPGAYGSPVGAYATWVHGYAPTTSYDGWIDPLAFVTPRLAPYDFTGAVSTGGGDMTYNGTLQVQFHALNTGSKTWYTDAHSANPVHLGATSPHDRGSGFYQPGSTGWNGPSRIKMDADTPPGQYATFTATFSSNHTPGSYPECFNPVVEGVSWMPERPVCVQINLLPPSYRVQFVNQYVTTNSDPSTLGGTPVNTSTLVPGQKFNVKFLLKNTGELVWNSGGANPFHLGTANPHDRGSPFATLGDQSVPASENWLSPSRPSGLDGKYDSGSNTVSPTTQINPGETGVFSFTMTAPSQSGSFKEYFAPLAEGVTWLDNLGLFLPIQVLPPGYHYSYVGQSAPVVVGAGTTQSDAMLQVKNTGQASWPVGGSLHLGTDRPMDSSSFFYTASGSGAWLSLSRPATVNNNVTAPGKATISPGEVAQFSFKITIPTSTPAGSYQQYVRPLMEGVTWMPEDYGVMFPVTVTAAPYDYAVLSQSFPTTLAQNSSGTINLAVRNTGRTAWPVSGPNALHLGTSRPQDRGSGFATSNGSDPWLSPARPSGIDGKVTDLANLTTVPATQINPGETALFRFTAAASVPPGTYNEYFNLVTEGVTWLPDYGVYIPFKVTPPAPAASSPSPQTPSSLRVPSPSSSPSPSSAPAGTATNTTSSSRLFSPTNT